MGVTPKLGVTPHPPTPLKDYDSAPLASSVGCHENVLDIWTRRDVSKLTSFVEGFVLRVIQRRVDWLQVVFGSFRFLQESDSPTPEG